MINRKNNFLDYLPISRKQKLSVPSAIHVSGSLFVQFFLARSWLTLKEIKVGKRQTIDTLISKEALLFAKHLRKERLDSEKPSILTFCKSRKLDKKPLKQTYSHNMAGRSNAKETLGNNNHPNVSYSI